MGLPHREGEMPAVHVGREGIRRLGWLLLKEDKFLVRV